MTEENKKMTCGCNHMWALRAILMVAILSIVFFCGVVAGELKATVRNMRAYEWKRGGLDGGRMLMMMKGAPADMMNPDEWL